MCTRPRSLLITGAILLIAAALVAFGGIFPATLTAVCFVIAAPLWHARLQRRQVPAFRSIDERTPSHLRAPPTSSLR